MPYLTTRLYTSASFVGLAFSSSSSISYAYPAADVVRHEFVGG
jgi:hypothetical protein